MNISQWKIGDRTFFSLEVDDRLLLVLSKLSPFIIYIYLFYYRQGAKLEQGMRRNMANIISKTSETVLVTCDGD